ncbi:MAG: hypothetical protein ACSHX9_11885 [Luteolibacter sp.]
MILELSTMELELIQHSVELRLQAWRWTEEYLRTGSCEGLIEECHKLSEAEWMVEQFEALVQKILKRGEQGGKTRGPF